MQTTIRILSVPFSKTEKNNFVVNEILDVCLTYSLMKDFILFLQD